MTRAEFTLKLNKLASVQLLHNYYDDQQCRDLTLVPTRETEKTLRNYHLGAKMVNLKGFAGLMLFFDPIKTLNLLRKPEWRPEKLSFLVLNNNSNFLNFTDLPFLRQYQSVYLSNLKGHQAKDGPARLHPNETFNASKAEVLQLVEPRFAHLFSVEPNAKGKKEEQGVPFSQIKVKDATGASVEMGDPAHYELHPIQGMVPDEDQITKAKALPQMQHMLDLSSMPLGKYDILPGTKGFSDASVYTLDRLPNNCIGVVDLYLNDKADKHLTLINPKAKEPADLIQAKDFAIHFEARSTIWRYHFINPKSDEFSDHAIVNKGKGENHEFGKAESIHLKDQPMSNGTEAIRMTSAKPIQLREFPTHRLELNMKKNGNGKMAIRLPSPRVETVKADHEAPDHLFSDIYVYV